MAHILHAVLLLAIVVCSYGAIPGHVSTFMIEPGSQGKETVKLVGDAISVSCTLEYDTSAVEEGATKKKDYTPAVKLLDEITKKYGCIDTEKDIFKYEICLGGEIKQSAGNEHYSLGKYEKVVEQSRQTYTKGSFCEVAHTDRKSVIEFTCADEVCNEC